MRHYKGSTTRRLVRDAGHRLDGGRGAHEEAVHERPQRAVRALRRLLKPVSVLALRRGDLGRRLVVALNPAANQLNFAAAI